MRVLLIFPPTTIYPEEDPSLVFPLGIGYLAAVLEQRGYEVHVIDCIAEKEELTKKEDGTFHVGLTWSEIREKIAKINPDVVGISCLCTADYINAVMVSGIVKEIDDIPVIFGGAHATALPKETLQNKNVDYVILGEGEYSLPALLESIGDKSALRRVDGIGFKENSKLNIKPITKYIEDLDSLPFPARHLFPMEKYLHTRRVHNYIAKRQPVAQMITSRGCPLKCTFCAIHHIWGRKWRFRTPKNVVDEIEHLIREYCIREIHFEDDNISLNKKRMMEICDEIIKRKLDITWTAPNGMWVQTLDRELLKKMQDSGCYRVSLGIENGNQQFLTNVVKKNMNLEKVRTVVKKLKELKIKSTGFFMVGIPGETKETILETIKFAKSLDLDDAIFSIYVPYPGAELYDISISRGYLPSNIDYYRFKNKYATLSTEHISAKQVEYLRNRALLEFQINKLIKHPVNYFTTAENYRTIRRYFKRFVIGKLHNYMLVPDIYEKTGD